MIMMIMMMMMMVVVVMITMMMTTMMTMMVALKRLLAFVIKDSASCNLFYNKNYERQKIMIRKILII